MPAEETPSLVCDDDEVNISSLCDPPTLTSSHTHRSFASSQANAEAQRRLEVGLQQVQHVFRCESCHFFIRKYPEVV